MYELYVFVRIFRYLLFYFRLEFFFRSLLFHYDCGFNIICNSYRLIANSMVVSDVLSQLSAHIHNT